MSKARITLICADMSRNAFGRAYVLARDAFLKELPQIGQDF